MDEETSSEETDASDPTRAIAELLMPYKFGLDEMLTKINILREELRFRGDANPIEHVSSRLKTIESIVDKAQRLDCPLTPEDLAEQINDISGIRIVVSFIPDAYRVLEMLARQPDVTVLQVKDYIADPKPSGYRSVHLIVEIPVFLSESRRDVRVEVQIRTVAMDFWASVEHKIYYKYQRGIPAELRAELDGAAKVAHELDQRMHQLHETIHGNREVTEEPPG